MDYLQKSGRRPQQAKQYATQIGFDLVHGSACFSSPSLRNPLLKCFYAVCRSNLWLKLQEQFSDGVGYSWIDSIKVAA